MADDEHTYIPRRAAKFSTVQLRGITHRIACWGKVDGDPVLLLHGFLDTCETYQFLVDEFSDGWNFLALDWRGFGDSARNGGPYWFPDYLADLDALINLLAATRPLRVVGHSMGGNVAALYAGVRPEKIRAVVSLEGFGLPRLQIDTAPQRYAKWLEQVQAAPPVSRYDSVELFAGVLQRRNSRLTPARARFLAAAWTRTCAAGGVELRADPWHRLVNPQLYRREEAEACWRAFPGPVQMVLAEESDFRARLGDDADDAACSRSYQRLTLVRIAGVGHMMHHENPALVAATIQPFLQRHP